MECRCSPRFVLDPQTACWRRVECGCRLERRLSRRIALDPQTGCWLYNGPLGTNGYKQVSYQNKNYLIHRLAAFLWMEFDLDSELEVIHRCNVHCCFNPEHLFIGTARDNQRDTAAKRRCRNSKKTHCSKGHPLSGSNVHVITDGIHFHRRCLTCNPRAPYRTSSLERKMLEGEFYKRDLPALLVSAEQCLPDDDAITRFMQTVNR